ncbi:MAG: hypothetical protein IKN51_03515 [Bacteroidaceae bacterium]|nr:hypothetical protein [Bacteroidaceae bacterium]
MQKIAHIFLTLLCLAGWAAAANAAYVVGSRLAPTDAADGRAVVIEAASTVANYGYYVKETAGSEAHWQLGFTQQAVWIMEQADATHYRLRNAVTNHYIAPCPKATGTAKTVADREDAALFTFLAKDTSPTPWTDYNDQKKFPRGWDDLSWTIYDTSASYAWRNDAGKPAEGNLWYGSGTHINMWNVFEAEESQLPVADVLDVQFGSGGTAADVSPMGNAVVRNGTVSTTYNDRFGRYVAQFSNAYGGSTSSFYKVDYAASRTDGRMLKALQDGHTLETLFCSRIAVEDKEAKWFSSHQQGGTGFLICKKANAKEGKNEITFLPYVGGYKWATSGVQPEAGEYYHVVGVWDKAAGKARIYVNGELKNEVAAQGNLNLSSNDIYHWFGIGGDPSAANAANASGSWDIVSCKIYDQVLTTEQVGLIYSDLINRTERKALREAIDKAKATISIAQDAELTDEASSYLALLAECESAVDDEAVSGTRLLELEKQLRQAHDGLLLVHDCLLPDGFLFAEGCHFPVHSAELSRGDRLSLYSGDTPAAGDTLSLTERGGRIAIPQNMATGTYTIRLTRGAITQTLGTATLTKTDKMPKPAQAVAHRGWYTKGNGTSQNSRAAIRNAFEAGFYGCEIDVHQTTDGYIFVNHDFSFGGTVINQSTYAQVKDKTLSNGEKLPLLSDFFSIMKNEYPDSPTKLVIELKVNANTDTLRLANSVVQAVREAGMQDRVQYISFGVSALRYIRAADPTAFTQSLTSMTPADIRKNDLQALDFNYTSFLSNPTWISEAEELGLLIDAFTIDDKATMVRFCNMGVDLITTNYPDQVQQIYHLYKDMMPDPDDDPTGIESSKKMIENSGQCSMVNAEGIASGSSAVSEAGADFIEPRERSGNGQCIYDLQGRKISSLTPQAASRKGIHIVRLSNGTSRKIVM